MKVLNEITKDLCGAWAWRFYEGLMKFDMIKVVRVRVEFLVSEEKWRRIGLGPYKKILKEFFFWWGGTHLILKIIELLNCPSWGQKCKNMRHFFWYIVSRYPFVTSSYCYSNETLAVFVVISLSLFYICIVNMASRAWFDPPWTIRRFRS